MCCEAHRLTSRVKNQNNSDDIYLFLFVVHYLWAALTTFQNKVNRRQTYRRLEQLNAWQPPLWPHPQSPAAPRGHRLSSQTSDYHPIRPRLSSQTSDYHPKRPIIIPYVLDYPPKRPIIIPNVRLSLHMSDYHPKTSDYHPKRPIYHPKTSNYHPKRPINLP